ncbi:MAG: hypothetical protein KIC80_02440 [Brachyspira sp.]|jgi:hypothetical protein|nr:hypothetical protein [Brachyspira sp.]
MFYVIKDNKLYEYGDKVSKVWNSPQSAKELAGVDMSFFELHKERFKIQDGELIDISETDDYKLACLEEQKAERINEIKSELNMLDLKCIRAIREGGNDEDGVAFLDKYQQEINTLREELNTLE